MAKARKKVRKSAAKRPAKKVKRSSTAKLKGRKVAKPKAKRTKPRKQGAIASAVQTVTEAIGLHNRLGSQHLRRLRDFEFFTSRLTRTRMPCI